MGASTAVKTNLLPAINFRSHANEEFTLVYARFMQGLWFTHFYARLTHGLRRIYEGLQQIHGNFMQDLRKVYARLHMVYARFTRVLREVLARFT